MRKQAHSWKSSAAKPLGKSTAIAQEVRKCQDPVFLRKREVLKAIVVHDVCRLDSGP